MFTRGYCCSVGTGWEWGIGMVVRNFLIGSSPPFLLSTSKMMGQNWDNHDQSWKGTKEKHEHPQLDL